MRIDRGIGAVPFPPVRSSAPEFCKMLK